MVQIVDQGPHCKELAIEERLPLAVNTCLSKRVGGLIGLRSAKETTLKLISDQFEPKAVSSRSILSVWGGQAMPNWSQIHFRSVCDPFEIEVIYLKLISYFQSGGAFPILGFCASHLPSRCWSSWQSPQSRLREYDGQTDNSPGTDAPEITGSASAVSNQKYSLTN